MWSFIRRRRELARDAERVAHLIMMRKRNQRSLDQQAFVDFASMIDVPPQNLHGMYNQESRGSGFDEEGRLKILYEPHVVSRNTGRVLDRRVFPWVYRGRSINVKLSYPKWKQPDRSRRDIWHPYYENNKGQWEMLATTYELHEGAIRGASYGAFQILGENAESLGYASTLDMIELMYDGGEFAQMEAAIRYMKRNGVIEPLRTGNWRLVEERFNGGGSRGKYAMELSQKVASIAPVYA